MRILEGITSFLSVRHCLIINQYLFQYNVVFETDLLALMIIELLISIDFLNYQTFYTEVKNIDS